MFLRKIEVVVFRQIDVLWGEKVFDDQANDHYTLSMRKFNDLLAQNANLEKVLLPLRDGLFIARKIG